MQPQRIRQLGKMGFVIFMLFCLALPNSHARTGQEEDGTQLFSPQTRSERRLISVKGGPESVVWVVQLSDLHFSVHNPERAVDFKNLVGPTLSMINPSLVLITGDLTDGKSKDLLTMKQNKDEWLEYYNVMEDLVKRSRLHKSVFYDLRGNHDSFGVPIVGGAFDFFSKYSINGQLGRNNNVNSVTIQAGEHKYLFVGLDTSMHLGLRGPTNLFGHPTDELLDELDSELSQWDSQSTETVTKVSFGHFPLSFSASSKSGRTLKDVFLRHSLTAYLCGHLHTRFGKNLKRHHQSGHHGLSQQKLFQLNMHTSPATSSKNCSFGAPPAEEFWEWELGDWRKSRAMRILAIDRGHVSYVDIDLKSGTKKTIILPTFPLDSRFMSTSSSNQKYECQHMVPSSYETVRALVFSVSPIVSVVCKIYDSTPGFHTIVMETSMSKHENAASRGDIYTALWNYRAFEDPSPDRYWLQIEAMDIMGRLTLSELRPFSINGLTAKHSWTWKEFYVMGCQWSDLYYPMFWFAVYSIILNLLVPKGLNVFLKKEYTYKKFLAKKGLINGVAWGLHELCMLPVVWFGLLAYMFCIVFLPWVSGQVFTESGDRLYMTFMGWVVKSLDGQEKHEYVGSPDVMVIVLPHLLFVVLPAIAVTGAMASERGVYREHVLSSSRKKKDDHKQNERSSCFVRRWIRKVLLLVCLAICWKHILNCRALMKAYEMNPLLHFPVYAFSIPVLLAYTTHKTKSV